jgi:glycosyltransferase involved in cell wall biosynthesis
MDMKESTGKMKILYLHQYFETRKGVSGTRSYEFGKFLAAAGHKVTMVTSGVGNKEFPCPPDRDYVRSEVDGIDVVSVSAGLNDGRAGTGMGGVRRIRIFHQFAAKVTDVCKKIGEKPDVVFATHTPLMIGLSGEALARHFGVPFVFEVRDLWPEALLNIGAMGTGPKRWAGGMYLRRMADRIYHAADHIVALSPGMKAGILKYGIPDEKVTVITNASDMDLFRPGLDGAASRRRLGLGDRFAAVYFGAMGLANGLEYAVEAARILKSRGREDIVVVLHGGGGKLEELKALAGKYELGNLVFSPMVEDKAEVARIVAGCNACMTIYRAAKEHTWSPNKMFDALAAGKPVLINVPGWLGETIENNKCGFYCNEGDPASLADKLEMLAGDDSLCAEMGTNARALAEREFDRLKLAARLEKVLKKAVAGG